MDDTAVTDVLAAAAQRGVDVTITMTADPEWDQAFAELARAGAHIKVYADNGATLYIHARVIVADGGQPGQQVLVGSQNFPVASLDYNRELGILTDPASVAAIAATLASDHAGRRPTPPRQTPRREQARHGALPRPGSTTPPTMTTTSTSTPTSPTRTRPRPPRATRTPIGPAAPAMR